MQRRRRFWGWGYEDGHPTLEELRVAAPGVAAHLGLPEREPELPVALEEVALLAPRLPPAPPALRAVCADDPHTRALHAYGSAYRDVVRAFRGRFDFPPDVVARPRDEAELEAVLAWAQDVEAAVVPWGGGTSVVGGVEPRVGSGYAGAISLDLGALDRVLEVDPVSRAARVQAGAAGPRIEEQLAPHGLTSRFYPQSFELSTLGGWVATRAAGHFATVQTHIDDQVESIRAVTPAGIWESRRLPGSGAGVSPDRLLLGSEGALGVITEAWISVHARPTHRAGRTLRFADFDAGLQAVRALAQSRLFPANLRLVDGAEARLNGVGDGSRALLVLGFEAADHPVEGLLEPALALAEACGGEAEPPRPREGGDAGAWRAAFLRAPYVRDTLVCLGVLSETFETAITWERLPGYVQRVRGEVAEALREHAGGGSITCRLTHAYPDGAAPYFTVLAAARRGEEVEQWDAIKAVASRAIIDAGGTITHHHAVGRDHRPWYDEQRPELLAATLRAAKATLDPHGILNPGVLVDPPRTRA